MKKLISMFVVLALVFSFAITAYAADTSNENAYALYTEYAQIINNANETYGVDLSLLPFDQIDDFCSPEEFYEIVSSYCQVRSVEFSAGPQITVTTAGARGVGVVTVPNVRTKAYPEDTITITFYGTFEVRRNLDGSYYIADKSFRTHTQSANGIIAFSVNGNPTTSLIDGGRTTVVTQNFQVIIRGYFEDYASVSASYYMSPANGNISALSY